MAKRRARRTTSDKSRLNEHEVYERIATESDFAELRRRYRRFAFPATVAFMVWYITYVSLQQLGPRLHGHQGHRQHQRRADLRAAAVRLHLHHRLPLLPLLDQEPGPAGHQAARRVRERRPADERPAAGPDGHREPSPHHRPVPGRRRRHPRHHLLGLAAEPHRRPVLRRRPQLQRLPERPGHQRRLHVRRVLPRHLRVDRPLRLRRLPLLHRLPGGLAGRPAAGRRAAAQLGPLHDGRPAGVPDAPGAGPQCRGHLDHRGLDLLPAGPDGRRRQPGRAAARRHRSQASRRWSSSASAY